MKEDKKLQNLCLVFDLALLMALRSRVIVVVVSWCFVLEHCCRIEEIAKMNVLSLFLFSFNLLNSFN